MVNVDAKGKILNLIKCKPLGFTLKDICRAAGMNRLTCTKYLEIMEAEGLIEHRNIGMAKLWFAKQRQTLLDCLQGEYSIKELTVDEKTDEIRSPAGLSLILMPYDIMAGMYFEFREFKGADERAYSIGKNVSLGRVKEYLRILGISPAHHLVHADKIINVIRYYCKSGWGRIKGVDVRREQVRIMLGHSAEAEAVAKHKASAVRKPVCNIMRGRIAGLFEGFCGVRYDAEETKCRAAGDSVCEFVVKPEYLK